MEPYYADGRATLYEGYAEAVLPALPPASVDLIVADPPYFRVKGEWWDRRWETPAGFLAWLDGLAVEWQRLLKPNGSLYCFASPELAARIEVLLGQRFRVLNGIRWLKEDGWHHKAEKASLRAYLSPWEAIAFCAHRDIEPNRLAARVRMLREAAGLTRGQVEVALGYVSSSEPSRGTALCYRWEAGDSLPTAEDYVRLARLCGHPHGDLRSEYDELRRACEDERRAFFVNTRREWSDIWRFRTVPPAPGKHPCEKPLALLEHLIATSSRPGDTVLDCFLGSGTTLRAAVDLGRKLVGVEVEAKWLHRSLLRLAQQRLPLEVA